MPTRVIAIPTSTRIRRPAVLAVMPTLAAASRNPTNVIASPTNAIITSLVPCSPQRGSSLDLLRFGLHEHRDRRGERDDEEQQKQKVAFGKQAPAQKCERHEKEKHRQTLC